MNPAATLVSLLIGAAVVIYSTATFARRRDGLVAVWQEAARKLGLTFNWTANETLRCQWSISGTLHGTPVRAQYKRHVKSTGNVTHIDEETVFHAGASGRIPPTLTVQADSVLRSLGRLVQGRDEEVGDAQFDALVELVVMDAYVCAALSASARKHLRSLIDAGGAVREGMIVLAQGSAKSSTAAGLTQMLEFLAGLAQLLSVTPDVLCERLTQNALTDPSPGVRLRNLRYLIDPSTHASPPELRSTLRSLLADSDAAVRLLAAKQLGDEGHATLVDLAFDARGAVTVRVDALGGLALARASQLERLLPQLLGSNPPELVCAALSLIATRRLSALSAAVSGCATSEHETVRAGVARALVALRTEQAEQTLIQLLADASSEVQVTSAESLGAVGTALAVEPLLALANSFSRPQLRRAAREALEQIEARLGDVEPGGLSLAGDQGLAGALSVPEEAAVRAGEISLVEEGASPAVKEIGERQRFSWLEEPAAQKPPAPRS